MAKNAAAPAAIEETSFEVELEFDKSTPGTHLFKDSGDNPKIPSLYVRKHAFKGAAPKSLTVTVRF
jgi:hypothetical protein